MGSDKISIQGARLHNLRNVSLEIPKNKLVVFTGLSGSGKSTLAFDTLHREGQRQYMESLGMVDYAGKPDVDRIVGLSPSISVGQGMANRSPRSTVGTATEVFTYLRVLFARIGYRPCPACGADVPPSYDMGEEIEWESDGDEVEPGTPETYPCPNCGAPIPEMGMGNFSFNKPAGACPTCTGLGTVQSARLEALVDESCSVAGGAVRLWDDFMTDWNQNTLRAAGRYYGFEFALETPVRDLPEMQRDLLFYGADSPEFRRHFPGVEPPDIVRRGRFEGVATNILRRYAEHADDPDHRRRLSEYVHTSTCPDCQGSRLRPEARHVRVDGRTIVDLSALSLGDLAQWVAGLSGRITAEEQYIAAPIITDLRERLRRLLDVGVEYLTLDRDSPTLSGGEAQRLRLATLLGSGLTGVLYVLDEPTIGLHPRDISRLIAVLRQLRDLGNTVLVIEHDPEVLRAADYLVDMGPGAGKNGGQVVAAGTPTEVMSVPESLTGAYLSGRVAVSPLRERRRGDGRTLTVYGAREHNLKDIDVRFPLGTLTAVTGVSGSGKSSLMFDILDRAARQRFNHTRDEPGEHDGIEGWEHLDKIITVDQVSIGRMPRSNAATYTEAFGPIREAFAATPEARAAGLTPGHFSFNTPGGRCERCQGAGVLDVKMHFLPDMQVRCPVCRGRRYKSQVLAIKYRGVDISQVLRMTIEEALDLFRDIPAVADRLGLMAEVGLGYLTLGQPATTLSGGEAQRVKLARELGRRGTGRTLYLLDEPSTGLHMADTARLILLLQRLVDAGNSVVVVEHNMDIIAAADWVVDLGPEGGVMGGHLVAEGTPEQVATVSDSYTGRFLREVLGH